MIPKKIDDAPGNYYVSVVDAGRVGLLAGPFPNDHAGALAMVKRARREAERADPWATFYAFGTVRVSSTHTAPGVLNSRLGLRSPSRARKLHRTRAHNEGIAK